jgi:hypothetical protein
MYNLSLVDSEDSAMQTLIVDENGKDIMKNKDKDPVIKVEPYSGITYLQQEAFQVSSNPY